MNAANEGQERRLFAGAGLLFGCMAVLAILDLATDLRAGTTLKHVAIEGAVAVTSIAGLIWMTARLRALGREARLLVAEAADLHVRLEASQREAEQFRREAADLIAGLGTAIDRQLDRWLLSPAEKDVALLLLKGLSHKEIADVRTVGEATVRQQARALYKKAGLSGRHDLAAFFLEDLLGPRSTPPSRVPAPAR